MIYNVGDNYSHVYVINDDNGNEVDSFLLRGEVIYADEKEYVAFMGPGSNYEISIYALTLEECRERYPKLDYSFDNEGNPSVDKFVPMEQDSENFILNIT